MYCPHNLVQFTVFGKENVFFSSAFPESKYRRKPWGAKRPGDTVLIVSYHVFPIIMAISISSVTMA